MAKAQDPAIAPDQIQRDRQQRITQILAQQRYDVGRHRLAVHVQVARRDGHGQDEQPGKEDPHSAVDQVHGKAPVL